MGQVLTLEGIVKALEVRRKQGQRLVSTNGCFDLLHVGHLRYLQQARAQGDCLILALNSDASVRELKGPKRPIMPQEERAELLAGLACIDYVFLFDELSPIESLLQLRPTCHVKGGQYNENTLPEAPALKAIGCELCFLPMVQGRSTTDVIETIVSRYAPQPC